MDINFSEENCLTKYNSERIEGWNRTDDQNKFGHTDVLVKW